MRQTDTDPALGRLLRDLRNGRGLSVKKLAKLAGVARKTIDNAEAGMNISVSVLKKILIALGIDEFTFRVRGRHVATAGDHVSLEALREVASEIRRTAVRLDQLVTPPAKASPNAQAERLVNSYTTLIRSVAGDPDQLAYLEHGLETLSASTNTRVPAPARRTRRRRSA